MDCLRLAALVAVLLFLSPFGTAAELCREVSLAYTDGNIDGHLQAPFSDLSLAEPERLSFSDFGYDGFHQLNFSGKWDYADNRFYLDYDRTRLDNDTRVPAQTVDTDTDFTSATQAVLTIPVKFSGKLDLYRLGYQRLFDIELSGHRLRLAPGAELAVLNFDFRQRLDRDAVVIAQPDLSPDAIVTGGWNTTGGVASFDDWVSDGPAVAIVIPTEVDRSYTKAGLRLGGYAEYWLSERFSLTAEVYDSIPADDWPEIFTAMVTLRFKVFENSRAALYLHAGAGRETLEYEDGEDDIRAEYRDLLQGGVSVRF